MKSKHLVLMLSLLFVLSIALVACAGDGEPEETTDENDSAEEGSENEEAAGSGELVITVPSDVVSLSAQGQNDVPSSNVRENIYETLTTLNDDQEIEPGLATDWEQVDDLTWEFHLQEGVTFHDGAEFNAEAVKKSFDRLADEEIASPYVFLIEQVESVEVVDDYTVRFNLEYPYAPLLANLAHSGTAIMSPTIIDEDYAQLEDGGDVDEYINQNPSGTGPFKLEDWSAGESVTLTPYEDYWGDNAKLDSVQFKVVAEQSSRVAELETGVTHVADQIGPNNMSRVDGLPDASVLQSPSVSVSYIGFNTEKEPFDDVRVRQALSMAINKDEIINGVMNGVGIPAIGALAPPVFGFDDSIEGLPYDVDQAKELLAEAGYEDGFETTIWTNDNEQRVDTAVALQAQLGEIGVDIEIRELEWGAYLEGTANGEHDMFILGWSTVTADADYGLYPLFHSSQHGEPGNRSFISDDEVDELLDAGRRETDPEARQEIYSEVQEKLVDLAPMMYTHHQEYLLGVSDSVKDFSINAQGIYQIKDAYIEE
ncbi:glutathione ABC transporter substrate-binding protein [Gracilibacillus lacisalsi]|uniref:glutathione ABC transporter substrate-binding protein n=1 Tax=Gracilibacillus lacisalsi TaxID=393087 RepID=UPI00037660D1|nr:glutathione ABC transporter substrate-binding protein [Gracilibacillus lacisalsi]